MKALLITLLQLAVIFQPGICINLETLFQPENAKLLQVMKEELNTFRVDMTKSFMEAHSRRRRAASGATIDDLTVANPKRFIQAVADSVGPFSIFTFGNTPYLIKRDGIYEISGLMSPWPSTAKELLAVEAFKLVGQWNLPNNEIVLNGFEWKHSFFLLTTNSTFSTIYTMHENKLNPIFRQRIFNKGNAVAGQFFEYRRNLYLVICNDNEIHSTTFSAIYRWAGSYMDEIHQVQTTGATAVETFTINSKKYIAIAQSRDSTGNMELGTSVLSMDHMERLERVQLLWSHGAVDLHYMSTEKEHFLIIAQEKEPSVVYWFGGMDFIQWQQFDGLLGKGLFLNGIQLNSDEPILIASEGGALRFFSRSASSATRLLTTWAQSKTFDSRESSRINSKERTVKAKFLRINREDGEKIFLAVTTNFGSTLESTKIFRVNIIKKQVTVSKTTDRGDSLSQCLQALQQSLSDAKPILARIQEEGPKVLRKDMDVHFNGVLESEKVVKLNPQDSNVKRAQVTPEAMGRAGGLDEVNKAPSKLKSDIMLNNDRLELLKTGLHGIVYKSAKNRMITGDLTFAGTVQFGNLDGGKETELTVDTINDVKWNDLQTSTLKLNSEEPQQVTGEWTMESLQTGSINVKDDNSKLSPNNFILKACQENQAITGQNIFRESVKFTEGVQLNPTVQINDVLFSDIVFKDSIQEDIKGFKHVSTLRGDFNLHKVVDVDIHEWFSSVAKVNSPNVQIFSGPVTFLKDAFVQVDQLNVNELNSESWDNFQTNVMVDGMEQKVHGPVSFDELRTDQLEAKSISGIRSESLLSPSSTQHVSSHLFIQNVHVKGTLTTSEINGVQLNDAVNRNDKNVVINGQVLLQHFSVDDVFVDDGVKIAEKDISEISKLRKVHIYSTTDDSTIILKNVEASRLTADAINGKSLNDLELNYWSKERNNVVNAPQLVLSNRAVSISNAPFQTRTLNEFKFPEEFVSLDKSVLDLKAPLTFTGTVTFNKEVEVKDDVTVNKIDMSKIQSMIVDETFTGTVRGKKTFGEQVVAWDGARFVDLNGMDLAEDVVMLVSEKEQTIQGKLTFEDEVQGKLMTVSKGDVEVEGLVSGLNLQEVKDTTAYVDKANVIEGDIALKKEINADKFSSELLNKINIKGVTDNLVFLDHEGEQFLDGGVTLEDATVTFADDSSAQHINSIPVAQYLNSVVRLDTLNGEIQGVKTFTNVELKDQLACSSFNGVDLMDLEKNAFSKSKSQEISGVWSLADSNMKGNLVTSELEGISFENLVFANEPFEISSPVSFTSRGIMEGPLHVEGRINGIEFNENLKDSVALFGDNKFDSVTVNGNLNWDTDSDETNGLSYFLVNAVQKSGAQSLRGKIQFLNGLKSSTLLSPDSWLNGVDLDKIQGDALLRDEGWVLTGDNKFNQEILIETLGKPLESLDAKTVNNVNLNLMNGEVYKSTDEPRRAITGKKTFSGGMVLGDLYIRDKFADVQVSELVVKNDPREIKEIYFHDLDINGNIRWPGFYNSGLDLSKLLNDRVSLTKPQQVLHGPFTFDSVIVDRKCKMPVINNVKVENTINRNATYFPPITGEKIFSESLTIDGKMNTFAINNYQMQELTERTLRLDQREVIYRPVIFEKPVLVRQPLELESVNDINLRNFSNQVEHRLGRLISEAENPEQLEREFNNREFFLQRMSAERPVWLEYLRLKQDLTFMGAKSKVNHIKRDEYGDILITFHQKSYDVQGVGLPPGCGCNKVHTLQIKEEDNYDGKYLPVDKGADNCLQVYNVASAAGTVYTVMSETYSTNATCMSESDKTTKVFSGTKLLGEMKMGHVSDVGVFSERDGDYLVLAQYFEPETRSHSTTTKVMRIGRNGLENVQNIDTHGAKKITLGLVNNQWMLAIANSKNSLNEKECNADSAIYEWSSEDEEFSLLRTVMTDGVFDVEFITTETGSEYYRQNFVAFAQDGDSASGEVLILRYENIGANFVMSQTIRSKWPITGLGKTCLCHQCFLTMTVPQEGVTFFENRFVEGFKEYYKAPVFGATDITSFRMNDDHLFAFATVKGPILAKAVVAGASC